MKFPDLYKNSKPTISFELFPPRTDLAMVELENRLPRLAELNPDLITVTYGAMGGATGRTLELASKIKSNYGIETAHHLTCVGLTIEDIDHVLDRIAGQGIENVVALRGDPPSDGVDFHQVTGGFGHGNELVSHINERGDFGIAVAGYPEKHIEAPDVDTDLFYLKRKVDSGADVIITQLYYDNRDYYRFVQKCREISIEQPIIPGLMPILNVEQIKRITRICGASIPAGLLNSLEMAGDDHEKVHEIGISHTAEQVIDLLSKGVPGIHFYVLNRYFHIAEVMERVRQVFDLV